MPGKCHGLAKIKCLAENVAETLTYSQISAFCGQGEIASQLLHSIPVPNFAKLPYIFSLAPN